MSFRSALHNTFISCAPSSLSLIHSSMNDREFSALSVTFFCHHDASGFGLIRTSIFQILSKASRTCQSARSSFRCAIQCDELKRPTVMEGAPQCPALRFVYCTCGPPASDSGFGIFSSVPKKDISVEVQLEVRIRPLPVRMGLNRFKERFYF